MFVRFISYFNKQNLKSRNFSTSRAILKSHYDSLGITPKATQNEIKNAYYKLSMMYHPDKNKGSLDASKKFQDISAAYEVLGNFKLRKLYDKGMLHSPQTSVDVEIEVDDHPEAKFYKSRKNRHNAPHMTGRTPIYNFDEWAKAHYGATFERYTQAKVRHQARMAKKQYNFITTKIDLTVMAIVFTSLLFMITIFLQEQDYDEIKCNSEDK